MMADGRWPVTVVGDVHGDAERLHRALDALLEVDTTVVMVGDYVNRGPDSCRVLDLLVAAREAFGNRLLLLRGNHEEALLTFLDGGPLPDFLARGGLATVHSYVKEKGDKAVETFRSNFPDTHRAVLEGTLGHFETEDLLISHTGFDPADPWSRSPAATYRRSHPGLFTYTGPWPRATTVCGHYVQPAGQPLLARHLVCVDTGCGTVPGAPLTAVRFPGRAVVQF